MSVIYLIIIGAAAGFLATRIMKIEAVLAEIGLGVEMPGAPGRLSAELHRAAVVEDSRELFPRRISRACQ